MAEQNKVALITGGGTGIGQSAALALQGDGWNVVVTGRRKEELDKTVVWQNRAAASCSPSRPMSPSQEEVKRLFAETLKASGAWTSCSTMPARRPRHADGGADAWRNGRPWSMST